MSFPGLPALPALVAWHTVDSNVFPYAARLDGRWLVLRLNDFPEHPLYTLFVDGQVIGDLNDVPSTWQLRPRATLPVLTAQDRLTVLRLMTGRGPYGAEADAPCTGDWCGCSIRTDDYAAGPSTFPRRAAE
ncbi:hypothetical protein [Streptomyces sp. TLI_171]|uniref:hypothetical protein n=1 Tax=Streptomyces sp. TLI_171 TaxID=1938859 RepID=UPI000C18DD60|nr:hypothetical protein [Streptomyces sp. TLI_171]RKE23472.1 hypothetical protein BX266_6943 [Streptomyces sp. TLI_171]